MPLEFEIMVDLSPSSLEGGSFALAHSTSGDLTDFLGNCTLFAIESGDGDVGADEVKTAIANIEDELKVLNEKYGFDSFTQSRFLFKTKSNDGAGGRFLSTEALAVLSAQGAKLVGIDMPTLTDKALSEAPKFSYIVNLCLDFIESGHHYKLLAPPLLMQDISPVPVRPVLVS